MPDTMMSLFDPGALIIVVAGTMLATVARCGPSVCGAAVREACGLLRRGFDPDTNRRALAQALATIQRHGTYRAEPLPPPDPALAHLLESYLRHGSIAALENLRKEQRALAEDQGLSAAQVFACAGELAPVLGLIGTLYGLTQLAPASAITATATIMAAVSSAVLTTLYGALLAHLVCFPLAGAIERRWLEADKERTALAEWFAEQLGRLAVSAQDRRAHLRGVA